MTVIRPNKPEPLQVFLIYWLYLTVRFVIVSTLIFFGFSLLLGFLIIKSGNSTVSWNQGINATIKIYPLVLIYSPFPTLIMTIIQSIENKKTHKKYCTQNTSLPIFRTQKAQILLHENLASVFSESLSLLYSLGKDDIKILEQDSNNGRIVAIVKDKKNKISPSQTIKFRISQYNSQGGVLLDLESSSTSFYKGMDYAANIKNIYSIIEYFQKNNATNTK